MAKPRMTTTTTTKTMSVTTTMRFATGTECCFLRCVRTTQRSVIDRTSRMAEKQAMVTSTWTRSLWTMQWLMSMPALLTAAAYSMILYLLQSTFVWTCMGLEGKVESSLPRVWESRRNRACTLLRLNLAKGYQGDEENHWTQARWTGTLGKLWWNSTIPWRTASLTARVIAVATLFRTQIHTPNASEQTPAFHALVACKWSEDACLAGARQKSHGLRGGFTQVTAPVLRIRPGGRWNSWTSGVRISEATQIRAQSKRVKGLVLVLPVEAVNCRVIRTSCLLTWKKIDYRTRKSWSGFVLSNPLPQVSLWQSPEGLLSPRRRVDTDCTWTQDFAGGSTSGVWNLFTTRARQAMQRLRMQAWRWVSACCPWNAAEKKSSFLFRLRKFSGSFTWTGIGMSWLAFLWRRTKRSQGTCCVGILSPSKTSKFGWWSLTACLRHFHLLVERRVSSYRLTSETTSEIFCLRTMTMFWSLSSTCEDPFCSFKS